MLDIKAEREAAQLIRRNEWIARKRLSRLRRWLPPEDYEELYDDCLMAIWRAGQRYDRSRGSFQALAERYISGVIANFLRYRQQPSAQLANEATLSGPAEDADLTISLDIAESRGILSPHDMIIINAVRHGYSKPEIAQYMGVHRTIVYWHLKNIQKRLSPPAI